LKRSKYFVPVLILVVFFFFLWRYGVFSRLPEIFENLDLRFVAVSLMLYALTYYFRALRFSVIFPSISVSDMMAVMSVHTFFNNVLPFRSGEASFPIILKKLFGVEVHASSTALLFVRFLDLLSLSAIFTVSVFAVAFQNKELIWLSFLIVVLLFLGFWLVVKVLNRLKLRFSVIAAVVTFAGTFISFRKIVRLLLYSLLTWFTKFASFYFIIKGGDLNLSFFQTVFVSTFGELTTILPIHSFAGFGTYEAGMVGGFKLLGVNTSYALTVAFYFHLILLLMSGILAALGWIYLMRRRSKGFYEV